MTPTASSLESPAANRPPRVHLAYLDGMRGLAALYVVAGHICQFIYTGIASPVIPKWLGLLTALLKFGNYAVCVFIVLSGYCLMLPVVRTGEGTLAGGIGGFIQRRARRILPPYYACLILTIALIAFVPKLQQTTNTQWDFALPALTTGSLISHALMVHNLFHAWYWSLDPPMWTVALEWQIYFVFALLLLPLWRRFGTRGAVLCAFVVGLVPAFAGGFYIYSWFLGLFALGMTAAVLNFSPHGTAPDTVANRDRSRWPLLSALLFVATLIVSLIASHRGEATGLRGTAQEIILDTAIGIATALFIAGYTARLQRGDEPSAFGRFLSSRPAVGLGHFSYSLYLVHYPLLALFYLHLLPFGLSITGNFAVLMCIFLPAVVAIAYVFHRCFELPFMRK